MRSLRIRSYTAPGKSAVFEGVEVEGGARMQVRASAYRECRREDGSPAMENITFVPDLVHNRCRFLMDISAEVCEMDEDGSWQLVPESYLEAVFAPAGALAMPTKEPASRPPLSSMEEFLSLSATEQKAFVESPGAPEAFLRAVAMTEEPRLSARAKAAARKLCEKRGIALEAAAAAGSAPQTDAAAAEGDGHLFSDGGEPEGSPEVSA